MPSIPSCAVCFRENMEYAAALKLPPDMTRAQRNMLVQDALVLLDLVVAQVWSTWLRFQEQQLRGCGHVVHDPVL